MTLSKLTILNLTVFITGACVLVLELVATRILSPYFGNTLYTVSSVITVVLGALSLGYYFGGKLADKHPKYSWFYGLIALSGGLSLLLRPTYSLLLPLLSHTLPIDIGPLFFSLLFFLIPNLILGTLSPFAVRLAHDSNTKTGSGQIAGSIFFWSTLGSIFGSLSTGFVLIPYLGINKIVDLTSLLLIVIGVLGLVTIKSLSKTKSLFILTLSLLTTLANFSPLASNVVYSSDGIYEKITITDEIYNQRPSRILYQDRSLSAAHYLGSSELVFPYTKYFQLYRSLNSSPKRVLSLGGGAYSIPQAILADDPNVVVDAVEIEPSLYELSKKYFELQPNSRLINHIQDGRKFLQLSNTSYDLIFSDVYFSLASIPSHFVTTEFFSLAKSRLSPTGFFIGNFIGNLTPQNSALTFSLMKTFRSSFPNSFFFAVESPNSPNVQNIIFVGLPDNQPLNLDHPIIAKYKNNLINLDRFPVDNYILLSDDYTPIEFLTTKLLKTKGIPPHIFDSNLAIGHLTSLVNLGSRHSNSPGNTAAQKIIAAHLAATTSKTTLQTFTQNNLAFTNIIARYYPDKTNRIIIATHYDSLLNNPGANNSASGTAVLLELARILPSIQDINIGVDLVLFDGEEGLDSKVGSDWYPVGSTYFSKNLNEFYPKVKPSSAIVLDMVCDQDLQIYQERNSLHANPALVEKIWQSSTASAFIASPKYPIFDDHIPLISAGIPSALIIDFDYPYYNTPEDTTDKCSTQSLQIIGDALLNYLRSL